MEQMTIPLEVFCESDKQHYLSDDTNIVFCQTDEKYYLKDDDNIIRCETDDKYYFSDDDDIIYIDGSYYLSGDDDIYCCDDCGTYVMRSDINEVSGGNYVCDRCLDNYVKCYECDVYHPIENTNYLENLDINVCVRCFDRYYAYCDRCEAYYHINNSCNCEEEEEYNTIHNYSYKPDAIFYRLKELKKKTLFLGIELETENFSGSLYSTNEIAEKVQSLTSFIYLKEDGSLTNGFEIVSHPFSWNWYRKNKSIFSKILSTLRDSKFRSYQSGNCGLHIHLTRNYFTNLEVYKIVKFFECEKDFITSLSQRNNGSTHYCQKNIDNPKYIAKNKYGSDRYRECNLTNCETIEFRFFRGTTNEASFLKAIQFCFSFTNWIKQASLNDINKKSYYQFVLNNKKSNKHLIDFIERKKLCVL